MTLRTIKFNLWSAAVCASLVFSGCQTRPSALVAPLPERQEVLFTFEDPAELKAWTFNLPANVAKEQSTEWAKSGRHSMKVTYDPGFNWPTISLVRPKKDAAGVDPKLARFYQLLDGGTVDTIAVTMRNPSDRDINLLVNAIPFRLRAQSVTPVEFSIRQLADRSKGEPTLISSFGIWGFPEQGAFSIYMDDVALYKKPDNSAYAAHVEQDQALAAASALGADRFVLGVESAMRQVYPEPHRYTPQFASAVELKAARNESECFQAVVVPLGGALKDLTWTLPPLVDEAGRTLPASVRVVGYVHCDPVLYALNADGGWYPDLLVDAARVAELSANTHLSLWVKVHAPADAKPGEYHGTLTVRAAGAKPQAIAVRMTVWPFTLPTRPGLKQSYQLCDNANGHGFPKIYPKARVAEMQRKFEDMLLGEYRMDVNNIYRTTPPKHWDAERLRKLVDLGLTGICLGHFPQVLEHVPGTNPDIHARIAEIKDYLRVVDEAGARKLCYFYGFDETGPEEVGRLFATAAELKKSFPDIPFLTTATAYQQIKGALMPGAESVDWWCPIMNAFFWGEPAGRGNIQKARDLGHGLWWYICNMSAAPEPNFDIELSPVEPRILMGSLAAKYEVMGFLYYAINYWQNNALPADTSRLPFVGWNPYSFPVPARYNGQGVLIVAGEDGPIPTIRMEMIRDGLEDYDTYAILRAAGPEGAEIASVPERVALNGYHHTTEPAVIEAERERLAGAILRLGLRGSEGEKAVPERLPLSKPVAEVAPQAAESLPSSLTQSLDPTQSYTLRLDLVGYERLLNLGEIQVFSGDTNIALAGKASMSSHPVKYPPANLIDGNTSGKASEPGGMAHTNWEPAPWAEIALPPTDRIDRIVIWNRLPEGDDGNTRLLPFALSLRDQSGAILWKTLIRQARLQTRNEMNAGDNRFQKIEVPVSSKTEYNQPHRNSP